LFVTSNQKTAMEVAEARGVVVAAITRAGIRLIELSPPEIKLAVTGDGRATKSAVARMVGKFLSLPNEKRLDDVTDALAIAIAVSGNFPDLDNPAARKD
jgi:crossover junction endodeoxyribonuclease RuvC